VLSVLRFTDSDYPFWYLTDSDYPFGIFKSSHKKM